MLYGLGLLALSLLVLPEVHLGLPDKLRAALGKDGLAVVVEVLRDLVRPGHGAGVRSGREGLDVGGGRLVAATAVRHRSGLLLVDGAGVLGSRRGRGVRGGGGGSGGGAGRVEEVGMVVGLKRVDQSSSHSSRTLTILM